MKKLKNKTDRNSLDLQRSFTTFKTIKLRKTRTQCAGIQNKPPNTKKKNENKRNRCQSQYQFVVGFHFFWSITISYRKPFLNKQKISTKKNIQVFFLNKDESIFKVANLTSKNSICSRKRIRNINKKNKSYEKEKQRNFFKKWKKNKSKYTKKK